MTPMQIWFQERKKRLRRRRKQPKKSPVERYYRNVYCQTVTTAQSAVDFADVAADMERRGIAWRDHRSDCDWFFGHCQNFYDVLGPMPEVTP